MSRILLVSINDINAEGLRVLSSILKVSGHEPHIIFFQKNGYPYNSDSRYKTASQRIRKDDWLGINQSYQEFAYSKGPAINDSERKAFVQLVYEIRPHVVGFYVTSPLLLRVRELSVIIKKHCDAPIIFGGPHATLSPDDLLDHCDFACVGEGERTLVEIAEAVETKTDVRKIGNLVYLDEGKCIQNKPYPLITDLDSVPLKDIAPQNKYLVDDCNLIRNFSEVNYSQGGQYNLVSSRGCPHQCSYCCENVFHSLYETQTFWRRRSPTHVIHELLEAQKRISFNRVHFDDEIFSLDHRWLMEFARDYEQRIKLPFSANVYPSPDFERNILILKKAGLIRTCLALQSGSERINRKIYSRPFRKSLFLKAAHTLAMQGIHYYVDIITYSPFESLEDMEETLDVLRAMPKPDYICVNKLYIMKNTKLHKLFSELKMTKDLKPLPKRIFDYYAILYWLVCRRNYRIFQIAKRFCFFKIFPRMIVLLLQLKAFFLQGDNALKLSTKSSKGRV